MGRKTYQDNFRVVLYPRRLGHLYGVRVSDTFMEPDEERRRKHYKSEAEDLQQQAKRHTDAGSVDLESDTVEVCEWCGSTWTEGNSPHNGGCCQRDSEVADRCELTGESET